MNIFKKENSSVVKNAMLIGAGLLALGCVTTVLATTETPTLGDLAGNIRGTFDNIAKLMIGVAYVAGIGFFIAAIFKFKQHKDNPTQIPMGTPIALLVIAVCLVFMPYIIQTSGATFIGGDTEGYVGGTAGQTGVPGLSGDSGS